MLSKKRLLFFVSSISVILASPILQDGSQDFETEAFTLTLDNSNQVATSLTVKSGQNAGSQDFSTLLMRTVNRTDDGFNYLGDLQIRGRLQGNQAWVDSSTSYARQPVTKLDVSGNELSKADITPTLGTSLPLKATRTWSSDGDSLIMSFNLTNSGSQVIEFGGLGFPLAFNNDWVGLDQTETWTQCVMSDPALSLDAGFVLTNRLGGDAPTVVAVPEGKTPLEQYRLNLPRGSRADYPDQFSELTPLDFTFEGLYSWWTVTGGLTQDDASASQGLSASAPVPWNNPSTFTIAPGDSKVLGLRFFSASGPNNVEQRLVDHQRTTMVGVPGLVVARSSSIKLIVNSQSTPSISAVEPTSIDFEAPQEISKGLWSFTGQVSNDAFGRARVTLNFENGEVATSHYTITKQHQDAMNDLGAFKFNQQWYVKSDDPFDRSPSVISYDHVEGAQVVDDSRAWVAGLSDEGGAGAYLGAASKQFGLPNKDEVSKLEDFALNTLWQHIQTPDQGDSDGGVKKSLFYYDVALEGKGVYQAGIDHNGTWDITEAHNTGRSYDYPHPTVVYYVLYRLARNNVGLVATEWSWFMDRGYDTIMAMKNLAGLNTYSQFGLMEGTYFLEFLKAFEREGATNSTLASRADDIRSFMKQRADLWNSQAYPFASEFTWDNTAQEELWSWLNYFNYTEKRDQTLGTVSAVMSSLPHWGYSGIGRSYWDFLYAGKLGPGNRLERILHHYKGSQSSLPLVQKFLQDPSQTYAFRSGYGGVIGKLSTIYEDGFSSPGFHSHEDYLNFDPMSGDGGVSTAIHALTVGSYVLNQADLGGWAGFGADVSVSGSQVNIKPTDSFRQRLFIAPIGLYFELDSGHFQSATYDSSSNQVTLSLDPKDDFTPNALLRITRTAPSFGPSGTYSLQGNFQSVRGGSSIPLGEAATTLTISVA